MLPVDMPEGLTYSDALVWAAQLLLDDLEGYERGGGYLYPETRAAMDRLRAVIEEF